MKTIDIIQNPPSATPFDHEPDPWPDPVDPKTLLDHLRSIMTRYVILPPCAAETLALWTLHTYAFQYRDISAYLGIESPEKRCGKTTLLTVLSELVHRPVVASNISSPAFFRVIEEARPTLMIDEADTLLRGNDELRGILNSGYSRKTAFVVRVTNQSHPVLRRPGEGGSTSSTLARFSCWCPKVIAAIGRLPETLADRCILIPMQRKSPLEPCERLRTLDGADLRRQSLRFITDHAPAITAATPAIPSDLNDRAADIWEPLFVLADLAGGDWPDLARQAAITLTSRASENVPGSALLLDILTCFHATQFQKMFSRALVAALNQFPDRPWSAKKKGKQITDLWLAQQLRPYGIRPSTIWIEDKSAKGYVREDIETILHRYVPAAEIQARQTSLSAAPPTPEPPPSETQETLPTPEPPAAETSSPSPLHRMEGRGPG